MGGTFSAEDLRLSSGDYLWCFHPSAMRKAVLASDIGRSCTVLYCCQVQTLGRASTGRLQALSSYDPIEDGRGGPCGSHLRTNWMGNWSGCTFQLSKLSFLLQRPLLLGPRQRSQMCGSCSEVSQIHPKAIGRFLGRSLVLGLWDFSAWKV